MKLILRSVLLTVDQAAALEQAASAVKAVDPDRDVADFEREALLIGAGVMSDTQVLSAFHAYRVSDVSVRPDISLGDFILLLLTAGVTTLNHMSAIAKDRATLIISPEG
jgi:hypothetical protein